MSRKVTPAGSARMPGKLQERPIWLRLQDGVFLQCQLERVHAALVAALTHELAIFAVQLADLEDSIVDFSHQLRTMGSVRPLSRLLHGMSLSYVALASARAKSSLRDRSMTRSSSNTKSLSTGFALA